HPLSIEDAVATNSSPKVEEYVPREDDLFTPYLFIVVHAVDYSRKDGTFATRELDLFLGKNFLVTYHEGALRTINQTEESARNSSMRVARAPDRLVHTLLDLIVENYRPALDELAQEIAVLEQRALEHPNQATLNQILRVKHEVIH